ncbi:dienelactone hydrolase family protein [Achromobacter denitrificans]|jgi:carboxymethylenebutenolidase|uniref:Dienelactone hydrolase family protein n=1 Tax=Achromobacter denitrificans TaxID=32002 RepID=A0A427WP93_ACHDE|nr:MULTISPECIES: dienelactone hydrolase family protein [Achromobacter]ASC65996.1 dienelactone hydrolase family protein [Achromobacter denitrificans]MDF3846964.1 dienelactone hydrolase family protein [Achromobacter denitrificans]MDF3941741.1 dienelactone hydrolase family protein [Achromobacter denitrificans]OLU08396.1 carboxymethylenebutenolidase [Achromobacter denitrificans]QKH42922.1 dienelactone hydrolase family protein [Achromobacter denitrificans]
MNDQDAHFDSLLPPLRLDRRGFIATTVATGFSLAAGQAVAQTTISTDAGGLVAGKIDIPTQDGKIPAYRAAPQGKKGLPTVMVVSEIFGVHEYIQDVCRRLAHQGYLAIAPELFARQGDPSKYTDIPKLQAEVISKVPDAQVQRDLDTTAAWAAANGGDPDRLGIVGFCWGGRQVWLYAAHNPKLKAGAAWYGQLGGQPSELKPRSVLSEVNALKAKVLGAYGGKDAGIPMADVDKMRLELAQGPAAAKGSRIDVYPDAPHAFHADYRPSYRKAEAEQAWTRMLDWFKQNGL